MNKEQIAELVANNRNIADFGEVSDGVTSEWIRSAEERLGVLFPPSFKWWLQNYGGGEIHGEEIFSIYQTDFDNVIGGDIVYMNELNRENGTFSRDQLVIQVNDHGEAYYFDVNITDDKGEYAIFEKHSGVKYCNNFLEFIAKKMTE